MMRMSRIVSQAALLAVVTGSLAREPLEEAQQRTRADIETARQNLNETYQRIAEEKAALTDACEALEAEIRVLADQQKKSEEDSARRRLEVDSARQFTRHLEDLSAYVATMALEYRRDFETRLTAAEAEAVQPELQTVDKLLDGDAKQLAPDALKTILDLSFQRCEQALGGERFEGEALDIDGLTLRGTFMTFGPLTFFNEEQGHTVGLAVQQVGSVTPTVFSDFDQTETEALQRLFRSGAARVPVDVTMGSGVRLRETRENIPDHLRKGGFIMIPLLLLGGVSLLIVCYKLVVVLRLPTARCQHRVLAVIEAVNHGEISRAQTLAQTLRRPLRAVISEGIEHRNVVKEHLEEILYEQILAQVPALERFLSVLAVCASAAPLLGLLGTVTGMIHTFRLITVFGTGDARLLSAGISEALITTEVGLMIAIPALLFHAYLSRRVRRTVGMAQEVSLTFVNGVKLKSGGPE